MSATSTSQFNSCPVCLRRYTHEGRLAVHIRKKHPNYQTPHINIDETTDLGLADLGIRFSSDEEGFPFDAFNLYDDTLNRHNDCLSGKHCLTDPEIIHLPGGHPFFGDSIDHAFPLTSLDDPSHDIIAQFIPQSEEYPGAAAIHPASDPTIEELECDENGNKGGEDNHNGRLAMFVQCLAIILLG